MTRIALISGGHSSGIVAIEVVRRFGKENVILLNHDIATSKEDPDIKRFKKEISDYLQIPITYANINGITDPDLIPDQFDVCMKAETLTSPNGNALCTTFLKTEPFMKFLSDNFPPIGTLFHIPCVVYYGFDPKESARMTRRTGILGALGYKTDYPLTWKERTILNSREIGIEPPSTYSVYEHANCKGCLKASLLHWFVTFVHENAIYWKGSVMEEAIDFTIHTIYRNKIQRPISLKELAPIFQRMKDDDVPATEHQSKLKFAGLLKKYELQEIEIGKPCECIA